MYVAYKKSTEQPGIVKSGQYKHIQVELDFFFFGTTVSCWPNIDSISKGSVYGRIKRSNNKNFIKKKKGRKGWGSTFCCCPQCAVTPIWMCLSLAQLRAQTSADKFKAGTPFPLALTTTLYSPAVEVQIKQFIPMVTS